MLVEWPQLAVIFGVIVLLALVVAVLMARLIHRERQEQSPPPVDVESDDPANWWKGDGYVPPWEQNEDSPAGS